MSGACPPEPSVSDLRERLHAIREEIAAAAARSGRPASAVKLVAVSKTQPPAVLQSAVMAGVTSIGENYLQEAQEKFSTLGWPEAGVGGSPVTRHFIGHLQANKVRTALRWFEMIETVDSFALAERVNRIAEELGQTATVLLQVNVSGERNKSGFSSEDIEGVLPRLANLAHIEVCGLMTIGRFEPDPEVAREEFIAMRVLRERLSASVPAGIYLRELSMGMSHDFPVAIEEGATIVRVGSRLFGPRKK